jgi:hypothetical protein
VVRLPQPGEDAGNWGDLLNDFLMQAHNDDGSIKPIVFKSQADRTGQIFMDAIDDSNGYVAKNIVFRAKGELSRGGPVWFDNHGRMQTWIGWHDKVPSGSSHHGFEIKTAADPNGPGPDVLATRFRLRSDADRTQAAFYNLENLYLDHGVHEPNTKFGIIFDEPQSGDVVAGTSAGRYRLGKIVASIDNTGAATRILVLVWKIVPLPKFIFSVMQMCQMPSSLFMLPTTLQRRYSTLMQKRAILFSLVACKVRL